MNLEKDWRKEIKKIEKGKGGVRRPWPYFWPTGQSRHSPPALAPFPAPAPRPRAWTAEPCRCGEPAELGRRVACMQRPGRALVGHQVRLATSTSVPAAICARQLLLSRSLALAPRAQSAAVAIGASSSASAVLPQHVSHSSIHLSPSSALASPLRNTTPSAWSRTVSPARPCFLLRREHCRRTRSPHATVPSGAA